ncbi:InlB B-repeat-containing protein [Acetivibrio clariflavus]|uniref:InlB B-repeat-containing protein n=1 Tax=Acetivibrio clariflavus TaxID=288965 RepID=UPI0003101819|nr:InlB B-repeat-containing protein [Acetivibrio clariflavus]
MLDFSDTKYGSLGLSAETTVDVGDFLAFFTGDFGDDNAQDLAYGEITAITVNKDGTTTITYKEIKEDQLMSAMDLYDETQLSETELKEALNKNKDEIQEIIEAQLMESDFFDDAGKYLAEIALKTDEVREIFGDNLTLVDCTLTYVDGTPLGADELKLMGNIIDKEQDGKKPKVSVSISTKTSHFDPKIVGSGVRVEVAVNYKFKIQKKGNNNIMEVELTAFFEQEFTFGFNVSGGAVWKWKWKIIPYIADYRLTGNLDIGTYTGLGITATAKLKEDKEPWGMPWPNSAREAAATKKIFSLSKSIKELMEDIETVLPEEEATASGGLAEKYARFMEDANEEWVDLVSVSILDLRSAVDPLHVLAFGLQVDFVVSANLNVAIGMTFQYENFKRHSFTLLVLSKSGENESIDLSTNGYQFDFYVMGTIGIRAGVRVKVTAGLFSTKLAAIGLQFETGAYARMWGYFYYHLENWKENGVWQKNSSYSGALLIEIGAYLDVKFIAEALNGKYSYTPSIYTKEWPLWSAGQRENVYDFAYEDGLTFNILNVDTYTVPKTVFDMYWMDLKTGETEDNVKNFDSNTSPSGDDEAYFAVDLTNSAFSYNPVNNQIKVNTSSGELVQSCEMKITWKGAPLSRSSEVLTRTIKLNWNNEANAGTIAFDSNGGSAAPMIRLLAGTALSGKMPAAPTRYGYTFAGWYTDKELNNSFTAAAMPKGNTTLYAKWTPDTVGYIVEHYQKALNGQYVLTETDKAMTGKVGEQTAALAKSYTGFTAQPVKQQTIVPDGTTRVSIYYDRNLYDLKFLFDNGSNDVILKVPFGSDIVWPSNPTKEGYTFAGWNADIPETMPANALIFTAQWTARTDIPYTVKHYKQSLNADYMLEKADRMSGTAGQLTNAQAKTYTGFTAKKFDQKIVQPDGSTVVELYYDRNINELSWNLNGGNPLSGTYTNGDVMYGTSIELPDTPTRDGYTFQGWYKDAELNKLLEDNATMPDVTLTLYAKWKPNQYTITFDSNGGSYVAAITQDCGTEVEAPANPTKEGYTFVGWMKDNEIVLVPTVMPAGDITLIAKWEAKKYTITFNSNGGSYVAPITQDYGNEVEAPADPTREGYTFVGWMEDNEIVSVPTIMPARDITLIAEWEINQYTITFDSNGGSYVAPITQDYGTEVEAPANPTREGYTFAGWKLEGENYTITVMSGKNITLVAEWTAHTNIPYTVEHYREELDGSYPLTPSEKEDLTGSTGAMINAVPKGTAGFTFDSDANGTISSGVILPDGSLVLKLYYKRNSYNVTWDADGGNLDTSGATTGSVKYGADITRPSNNPTKTGHTFNGWLGYTENMTMPAKDITFRADWTVNRYTITFDSNGGSPVEAITQDYGTEVKAPTAPTKSGYRFVGWQLNGENYTFTTMPAENITLVAVWSNIPIYTVSFDANGGTVETTSKTVFAGSSYGELPIPEYGSQFFLGWFTAESGGTKVTDTTVVELDTDHTLYARWSATGFTGSVHPDVTIYVAGIKVTTENMNDILGDGSGSVQFDPNSTEFTGSGYISNAGKLYLNNATISGISTVKTFYLNINATIYAPHSMTIVNTGSSTVINPFDDLSTDTDVYGIYISGYLNIEGSGTLTATSGQGGAQYNCGIRVGVSGAHLKIYGVKVEAFAGTAGNNGRSYGVCVGILEMEYKVFLNPGTLEAHGYDSAVYCGDPDFPYRDFTTVVNTYIGGMDYDGSDAESVTQTEEYQYRNYKYILATVQ